MQSNAKLDTSKSTAGFMQYFVFPWGNSNMTTSCLEFSGFARKKIYSIRKPRIIFLHLESFKIMQNVLVAAILSLYFVEFWYNRVLVQNAREITLPGYISILFEEYRNCWREEIAPRSPEYISILFNKGLASVEEKIYPGRVISPELHLGKIF